MKVLIKSIFVALLAAGLIFIVRNRNTPVTEESTTLTVGISADNPPFTSEKNGTYLGLEVDLITEIARRLNRQITIKDLDFPSLIPAIKSGVVDLAISHFGINEERKKNVAFSIPYMYDDLVGLGKEPIHSLAELSGKTVGVQLGSTCEAYIKSLHDQDPTIRVLPISRATQIIQEIKSGMVDVAILDKPVGTQAARHNQDLTLSVLNNVGEAVAIVFPLDSTLVDQINEIIEQLKQEGFMERLEHKWINEAH